MFLLSVYRNRLESNTEHWNALLLSLRELIEWVIRKDTELTGLGPVCGDVAALQKQEASFFDLATSIVCVSTLSLLFRRTKNVLVKDRCFDGKKKRYYSMCNNFNRRIVINSHDTRHLVHSDYSERVETASKVSLARTVPTITTFPNRASFPKYSLKITQDPLGEDRPNLVANSRLSCTSKRGRYPVTYSESSGLHENDAIRGRGVRVWWTTAAGHAS